MSKREQDRPRSRNDITTTKMMQIYEMPDYKKMRENPRDAAWLDYIGAGGMSDSSIRFEDFWPGCCENHCPDCTSK